MQSYWTKQPEPVLRDLVRRFGRVWCDEIPAKAMRRLSRGLQKREFGDIPVHAFNKLWGLASLSRWQTRGGVLREEPSSRYIAIDRPVTPAKLSLYCPLNRYDLGALALQATEVFVVRIPGDWNVYRRLVSRIHPSAADCERLLATAKQHRATDFEAACAGSVGHGPDIHICTAADIPGFNRMVSRATRLSPPDGPDSAWPVKLVSQPLAHADQQFHDTYRRIDELSAKVDGWSLVTPDMWSDGIPERQVQMMEFAGHVLTRPRIYFFSTAEADLKAAEHYHRGGLDGLEDMIRMIAKWDRYPAEDGAAPIQRKMRSARSLTEPSDEPDEARLPDSASPGPA